MSLLINILLLIFGFAGAIAAIGGDTWIKKDVPLHKRITRRGWLAIACLIATLGLGVAKEVRASNERKQSAKDRQDLNSKLNETKSQLDESQYLLQNLLRSSKPSEQAQDMIREYIVAVASQKGYKKARVTADVNTTKYVFHSDSGDRNGYVVLLREDITELSMLKDKDFDRKIHDILFGRWSEDDIEKDFKVIYENIEKIAHSILSDRFEAGGISSNLNWENKSIHFYPIDRGGKKISKDDVMFSRDDIIALLDLPSIERGAVIATKCELFH